MRRSPFECDDENCDSTGAAVLSWLLEQMKLFGELRALVSKPAVEIVFVTPNLRIFQTSTRNPAQSIVTELVADTH